MILKAVQFVAVWAMRHAVYIIALAIIALMLALSLPARADLPAFPVFTVTIPGELFSAATVREVRLTCVEASSAYPPLVKTVSGDIQPSFSITLEPGELPVGQWTCDVVGEAVFGGDLLVTVPSEGPVGPFVPVSATIRLEVR